MESTLTFLADYGTDLWFPALVTAAIAYFCGCFNGAVIVSKYILRDDVRNHGSGNAGLTNFYRTFGGPLTFVVILCDVLKAVVAIKMAVWLTGQLLPLGSMEVHSAANALAEYWGGLWCLLGHMFPCMFHFKGGKGILSGGAIAIMIDWRIALVVHLVCVSRRVFDRVRRLFGLPDPVHAPGQHPAAALGNRKQVFAAPQDGIGAAFGRPQGHGFSGGRRPPLQRGRNPP